MPKLIRLYIQSIAIGVALAAGFVALMVWMNLAGLGNLILGSSQGWVAAIMMVTFFSVLFSGVQFGIRIMMMAEEDEPPMGGLRQHLVPVPVKVEAQSNLKPSVKRQIRR